MSERDDARLRRRQDSCAAPDTARYARDANPQRPTPACGTPTSPPDVVFYDPVGCPVAAPPPDQLPDPLVFYNTAVTRTCADLGAGPIGTPVTIAAGSISARVYFQTLSNITVPQLTMLAGLSDYVRETVMDAGTSVSEIARLLQLQVEQAAELHAANAAARSIVAAEAVARADGALVCVWQNTAQTATCGTDALTTEDAPTEYAGRVNNPVVVAAGAVSSTVSQADADAKALAQAQAALRCLWANTAQTATCVDDLGYTEVVENDAAIYGNAGRLRVGSVTVAANTIFSDYNQADADALALQQAISSLDCFYLNAAQTAVCAPDPDGVAASAYPDTDGADASRGEHGNPVTMPAGSVESNVSTAAANDEALSLAVAALDCRWYSDAVTAECAVVEYDGVEYTPAGSSPVISVTLSAGEVISLSSKAAANDEAQTRAELSLDCLYCNQQVDPLCVPPDYIVSEIPVPLADVTNDWSMDATRGVPAGMFCASEPVGAQSLAESLAAVPLPPLNTETDCAYGNDPVTASCIGDEAETIIVRPVANVRARGGPCVGGADGTDDSKYVLPGWLPAENEQGVREISIALFPTGTNLSSQSYPNPWAADPAKRQIEIARNTFTVDEGLIPSNYYPASANRAKMYANELAATFALSSLNCFFANCPGYYLCDGTINLNEYHPTLAHYSLDDVPVYGTGTMLPVDGVLAVEVDANSRGSLSRPVYVNEGQFISYVSETDVQAALEAFLLSVLDCYWSNSAYALWCGATLAYDPDAALGSFALSTASGAAYDPRSTGAAGNPVTVAAHMFRSEVNPDLPQIQAIQLGLGQLDCFFSNDEITSNCSSGVDPLGGAVEGQAVPTLPNASGATSVTIPAGLYLSPISKETANAIAESAATNGLRCWYDSEVVSIGGGGVSSGNPCPEGTTRVGPDSLPRGAVISPVSTAVATDTALTMLRSMQTCLAPDDIGGGAAGPAGAQSGCEGECHGYFS